MNGTINGIVVLGDLPPGFAWRDRGNHNVPVTKEAMVGLGLSVMQYIGQVYQASWIHKNNIDTLTTIQDVENYDMMTGWPSNDIDGSSSAGTCAGPVY